VHRTESTVDAPCAARGSSRAVGGRRCRFAHGRLVRPPGCALHFLPTPRRPRLPAAPSKAPIAAPTRSAPSFSSRVFEPRLRAASGRGVEARSSGSHDPRPSRIVLRTGLIRATRCSKAIVAERGSQTRPARSLGATRRRSAISQRAEPSTAARDQWIDAGPCRGSGIAASESAIAGRGGTASPSRSGLNRLPTIGIRRLGFVCRGMSGSAR
jgi:hypothetical protein